MDHELKIWPQYYARVADGSKTFEIRKNDRDFQVGDTVTLKEWDPEPAESSQLSIPRGYTDSPDLGPFTIGYVAYLGRDEVVFSLIPGPAKAKKQKP